jgi:hypothetical protein
VQRALLQVPANLLGRHQAQRVRLVAEGVVQLRGQRQVAAEFVESIRRHHGCCVQKAVKGTKKTRQSGEKQVKKRENAEKVWLFQ